MKEMVKDAESGKTKDKAKGLGHWTCSACQKKCKVTPRKPAPKEIVDAVRSINAASVVPIEEALINATA
jgi:heterodisulfide reductase subunit C